MPKDAGAFGDLFGGITALFSGLAFAGIIYTVILQTEELGYQRTELKLQREEMKKTSRNELFTAKVSALSNLLVHARESVVIFKQSGVEVSDLATSMLKVSFYADGLRGALSEIQSTLDED